MLSYLHFSFILHVYHYFTIVYANLSGEHQKTVQVLIGITFEVSFQTSKVLQVQSDNTEHTSQVEKLYKHLSQFTEVIV